MAQDDASTGFLGRWSRRKVDAREGRSLGEPVPMPKPDVEEHDRSPTIAPNVASSESASVPTLSDANQLTSESNFADFMTRGVAPEVKNAAMKKLFADPHFNVMDRMDVYIDDYSLPDPLPLALLRQMNSAKTLNLFDDDAAHREVVAQSAPAENNSNFEPPKHDNVDLRLQPDPALRSEGSEPKSV